MNICLLLRGISYLESYKTSQGHYFNIDYNRCKLNLKKNLIDCYKNTDVFISTYDSIQSKELIDYYKPKNYIISSEMVSETKCLIDGIDLIKNYEDYDFIIVSRIDIHLKMELSKIPFSATKFNFLWKEYNDYEFKHYGKVANVIWIFKSKYINSFRESIIEYQPRTIQQTHYLYVPMISRIGEENTNFVFDGFFSSDCENPLYEIDRTPITNKK